MTSIPPTPWTLRSCSLTRFSAKSPNASSSTSAGAVMPSVSTGAAPRSTFSTCGGCTSGGRVRSAEETLSRTSWAATLMSPRSNISTTLLTFSRLVERRVLMPDTCVTASSSGLEIFSSIVVGSAPG